MYDGNLKEKWILLKTKIPVLLKNIKFEIFQKLKIYKIEHNDVFMLLSQYQHYENFDKNFLSFKIDFQIPKFLINKNITGQIKTDSFTMKEFNIDFIISSEKNYFFNKIFTFSVIISLFGCFQILHSINLLKKLQEKPKQGKYVKDYKINLVFSSCFLS